MTTAPAKTPPAPRPLWERHQLFQEPAYVDGQPYGQDDSDGDEDDTGN